MRLVTQAIALLLVVLFCSAYQLQPRRRTTGGGAALCDPLGGDYSGCDFYTDFEGTGAPSGWTAWFGTPDWDYTTTPLNGSQSMECSGLEGGEWEIETGTNRVRYFGATMRAITSLGTSNDWGHGHVSGTDSVPTIKGTFGSGTTRRLNTGCGNVTETTAEYDWGVSGGRKFYIEHDAATGTVEGFVESGGVWVATLVQTAASATCEVDITGFTLREDDGTDTIVYDDAWWSDTPPEP